MFIDKANHIYIAMLMYKLIEYSGIYLDISGSLWQFKRDKVPANNANFTVDNGVYNSQSFKYSILFSGGNSAKFKIGDAKLHVSMVTLSTKDHVNLTEQLSDGFKRSVYWNSYQAIPAKVKEKKRKNIYELLSASSQVLKHYLFLLMS